MHIWKSSSLSSHKTIKMCVLDVVGTINSVLWKLRIVIVQSNIIVNPNNCMCWVWLILQSRQTSKGQAIRITTRLMATLISLISHKHIMSSHSKTNKVTKQTCKLLMMTSVLIVVVNGQKLIRRVFRKTWNHNERFNNNKKKDES